MVRTKAKATKSYGDKPQSVNKKTGEAKLRSLYAKMAKGMAAHEKKEAKLEKSEKKTIGKFTKAIKKKPAAKKK